jgi:hypothetical protein
MKHMLATPSQMKRYPVRSIFREAANFAKGALIGAVVTLFVWVMIG